MGRRKQNTRIAKPDVEERIAVVQQLMLAGYTISQIVEFGRRRDWTAAQCTLAANTVAQQWQKQSEEELQTARAQAIQRLRADLARMRIKADAKKKTHKGPAIESNEFDPATYKDIVAHERLLAQIEGTLRPVEVKVSVGDVSRRALIDVINGMTPEEMNALVAEQKILESRTR